MWVPPTFEMSKHSIRTGSASSAERRLEPLERLDALLAAALGLQPLLVEREPRVALGELEDAALVAALRRADLDARRRGARRAARPRRRAPSPPPTSLLHDDQRRDRERARVVLQEELLGDDRRLAARPGCRGRTTGGRRGRRRAPGRPARWPPCPSTATATASNVPTPSFATRWRSSSADRLQAVALERGLLEVLLARGEEHLALEVAARSRGSGRRGRRSRRRSPRGTPPWST